MPVHKRRLAYVFQEASLFEHLDVAENLRYAYQRAAASDRQCSPLNVAEMLGIEHLLKRNVALLSGGERQRVAIARAVCSNPQIMLMDEPLTALDRESKRQILAALELISFELNIPIIYVSHALDEVARLADYVVLMEQGRITASGTIQAMLTALEYPMARDVDAESVVMARLTARDDRFGICYLDSDIGQISILNSAFKVHPELGDSVRVLIAARDVSITLECQENTSILNIFRAQIGELLDDGHGQMTVRAMANNTPLLARITIKSSQRMSLKKGDTVYLQAKSVALL